ncbi:MAG: hypothetical protein AMXMBFR84_47770 [Candidatus Hydrogenedentota bacterium]
MTDGESRVLGEGRFLRLVDNDGWEHCERKKGSGVVAIVPLTDHGSVILIEQHRPAVQANVIEIPAGLVGDDTGSEHEPMLDAARRELLEETGYTASDWLLVTEGPSSAGMSTEQITVYIASGLTRVAEGGGVHNEDIAVFDVPIGEAEHWLDQKRQEGAQVDLKVYLALYYAVRFTA